MFMCLGIVVFVALLDHPSKKRHGKNETTWHATPIYSKPIAKTTFLILDTKSAKTHMININMTANQAFHKMCRFFASIIMIITIIISSCGISSLSSSLVSSSSSSSSSSWKVTSICLQMNCKCWHVACYYEFMNFIRNTNDRGPNFIAFYMQFHPISPLNSMWIFS